MGHSNYSNYSDKELLQVLSEKRSQSPVIEELCQRLEEYSPIFNIEENSNKEENIKADCPVCEARLNIIIDVSNLSDYKLDI